MQSFQLDEEVQSGGIQMKEERMDLTANFGSKAGLNGNISVASRGRQYHSDILQ
jgi:hypothetical protein